MGFAPVTRVEALLDDLWSGHGYCLPPEEAAALVADPPQDVDTFVDAVLVAEGLSPTLCDGHTRLDLGELMRDRLFDEGRGKGSKSGLPLLPLSTGA